MIKQSKSGYWIQKTHLFRADEFICSVCNSTSKRPYVKCHNCGADMKDYRYDPNWVDEIEGIDAFLDD